MISALSLWNKVLVWTTKKKIINSFLNFYQINSILPITFYVVHWPPNSIALFPYPAFYILQTHSLFHKSRFSLTLPSLSTHKWWSHIHRFSWWGFRWNHRWGSGAYVKTWKLNSITVVAFSSTLIPARANAALIP